MNETNIVLTGHHDPIVIDDEEVIGNVVNPEELLEKTITRSEKTTKFSKIKSRPA